MPLFENLSSWLSQLSWCMMLVFSSDSFGEDCIGLILSLASQCGMQYSVDSLLHCLAVYAQVNSVGVRQRDDVSTLIISLLDVMILL